MPGWQGVMERLGFSPARLFAVVSMATELVGGLLLAAGLLTPVAVAALLGQSIVIILKSHLARGFWNRDNGFEFPLALAASVAAIGLIGPARISLDAALGIVPGDTARLLAIATGIIGGAAALAVPTLTKRSSENLPER